MKKIWKVYKPYMLRPIIYQAVTRFSVGLAAALLLDRFVNVNQSQYSAAEFSFLAVGIILLAAAWFNYLKLDGLESPFVDFKFRKKKKKKHFKQDIVDFVDEKIISFDELQEDEQTVCKIGSSLLAGACLIIPALLDSYIF